MSYPYDAGDLAAITRLGSYYNVSAYDAGSNAGGLAAGGHRVNFVPALGDVALISQAIAAAAAAGAASAVAAAASETNAAASAAQLAGTSTTSVAVGTGAKSFTTQAGKFFGVGTWVLIESDANPTLNWMAGQVTAYSGTALTVNVTTIGGSGTYGDWTILVSAKPGAVGATGATGATGPSPALQFTFSTGTSDSDPGNGLFKFNSATTSAVTFIYFDNLNKDSQTVTSWLDALDDSTNTADRGRLYFVQPSDPSKFAYFKITGAVIDGTGYRKVPVAYIVASDPAAAPFTNAAAVAVDVSPTGNKGVDGGGAGDVIGPSGATDNGIALYDGTTGKLLKDAAVGIGTSGSNLGRLDTANTYSAAQTFAATLDIQQQLLLSGDISPSQITSNQTDYNPAGLATAAVLRLSTDAARSLYSLAGGADGRVVIVDNVGSFPLDVIHDDGATGTAAMRFALPANADVRLGVGQCAAFKYDATAVRWRLFGLPQTRASLGLNTTDSPMFVGLELGHASDTTIARSAAGIPTVEGEYFITTKDLSAVLSDPQKLAVRTSINASTGTAATTTAQGPVELATDAETQALTDAGRAVTPSNLAALVASQAQLEAASANDRFATPGRLHHHPGVAKAVIKFNGTGTIAINSSYGVSGISRNGTGDYTITFTQPFSSVDYTIGGSATITGTVACGWFIHTQSAGSCRVIASRLDTGAAADAHLCMLTFHGDH